MGMTSLIVHSSSAELTIHMRSACSKAACFSHPGFFETVGYAPHFWRIYVLVKGLPQQLDLEKILPTVFVDYTTISTSDTHL